MGSPGPRPWLILASLLVVLRCLRRSDAATLDDHPTAAGATVATTGVGAPVVGEHPPRRTGGKFFLAISALVCVYLMAIGPVLALDYWGFGVRRPLAWMGAAYMVAVLVALALTRTSRGPALLVIPLALLMGVAVGIVILERWHTPQIAHGLSNVNEVRTYVFAGEEEHGERLPVEAEHPEVSHRLLWESGRSEGRDLVVLEASMRLASNETFVAAFPKGAQASNERTAPEVESDHDPPPVERLDPRTQEWDVVPDAVSTRYDDENRLEMTVADPGARDDATYRVTLRATYDAVERPAGPGRTRHSLWWWSRFSPEQTSIEFADREAEAVESPYPTGRANARRAMTWAVAAPDRYQVDTVYRLGLLSDAHKYLGLVAASALVAQALTHPRRP
jgi:hypothetical protein